MIFAALRFAEDENLADRTYWYRCPFAVAEGEKVFAPVGSHDRIQRARVERVLEGDAAHAPYDVRFLKSVAAKCGAYRRRSGGVLAYETGGVPYDGKHFTRFGRVLFTQELPQGVPCVCADDALYALRALLETDGCALLAGGQAARASALLLLLSGVRAEDAGVHLARCNAPQAASPADMAALSEEFSEAERARLAQILR